LREIKLIRELGEKKGLRKGYTVRKSKTAKIILDTYGNYLGMGRGCLVLKNEKEWKRGDTLWQKWSWER